MKFHLISLLLVPVMCSQAQTNTHLRALNAYLGSWLIYKNDLKVDTICLTISSWSDDGTKLTASQVITSDKGKSRDSCFYSYDSVRKIYSYYETDITGRKIISRSDILIHGKTWIYQHQFAGTTEWRTVNTFNSRGDEISFQTERSDDRGKTWTTTRSGKEYKIR